MTVSPPGPPPPAGRSAALPVAVAAVADASLFPALDRAAARAVVGATQHGTVDAGATWEERPGISGSPQAVAAHGAAASGLRVVVVSSGGLHDRPDGGETFALSARAGRSWRS